MLKLWQARDTSDPARLMRKFEDGRDRAFGFLADLTDDEHTLARDQYQREHVVVERLRAS